jgi:hypothetical protein
MFSWYWMYIDSVRVFVDEYDLCLISVVVSTLVFQSIFSLEVCRGCPLTQAPSDGGTQFEMILPNT